MNDKEAFKAMGWTPEISAEDIDDALQTMKGYIFYSDGGEGRHFECSRCRESFDIPFFGRVRDNAEYEALHTSHNEAGICPRCGRSVTFKHDGKTKRAKILRELKCFAVPYVMSYDRCYIVCFSLWRDYAPGARTGAYIWIDTVYALSPGEAYKFYHGAYDRWWVDTYNTSKSLTPFVNGSYSSAAPYSFMKTERLRECFLERSEWEKWGRNSYLCQYLYAYCTHMQFEILMRMGLCQIVDKVVFCHEEMKRQFDWSAKGPAFFRTMDRSDIEKFKNISGAAEALKLKDRFSKICTMTLEEADRLIWSKYITTETKRFLLRYKKDPRKFVRYMSSQKYDNGCGCHAQIYVQRTPLGDWKDYAGMCEQCGADLSDDAVFFPKDIAALHDRMVEVRNALAREKKMKDNAEAEKKAEKRLDARRKKYEWSDGEYTVRVPETLAEIVAEGQAQKNCVAGYTERHAGGRLTILFIRRADSPDKSLITVEMSKEDRIVQARTYRNGAPGEKERAFIKKYEDHIEKMSNERKKKNGNGNDTHAA